MGARVAIQNTIPNGKSPRLPFLRLKEAILGKDYELSVAFVTPETSHALNKQYRGKDYPTDVLSFPLGARSGELVLDLATTKTQAPLFNMPEKKFLLYLVIHGMLHLKGYDHGSKMEREEKKFLKKFS
jgi:probable rRNA maturation factor